MNCIVVTPEETVLETETDSVALPLYDGEIGILNGHAPMIGRLGYGELRIRQNGEITRLYVDGGFVQVADNVVSVLTNRAIPPSQLDAGTIEREIADALGQHAAGEEALALRDRTVDQARGQLRVARK